MVRTQLYLTEEEKAGLDAVARTTDRKQSAIIREAVDRFLDLTRGDRRSAILDEAAGMWKNRRDLPDFETARRSWDRG
jgi:predicted transcriptional regulator